MTRDEAIEQLIWEIQTIVTMGGLEGDDPASFPHRLADWSELFDTIILKTDMTALDDENDLPEPQNS